MLASAPGSRGVARLSPRVHAAMTEVPRHEFVPPEYGSSAYRNTPLPIGHGQTISQPLIVALMTELLQLEKTDKVLEVGTGSGYQAAILSVLAGEVYTIEIVPELGKMARANLERLGYSNVSTKIIGRQPGDVSPLATHLALNQAALDEIKHFGAPRKGRSAEALLVIGEKPVPRDLDEVQLAAWTSVARVLLNLHETITRN